MNSTGSNPFVFALVHFRGQRYACPGPGIVHSRCLRRVHTTRGAVVCVFTCSLSLSHDRYVRVGFVGWTVAATLSFLGLLRRIQSALMNATMPTKVKRGYFGRVSSFSF